VKKKRIPERWNRDYASALEKLPEPGQHALKTAIEEIAALEGERNGLLEDTRLLETSLKDLQDCRIDNMKLRRERHGLEDALRKCREGLVNLERRSSH
jgi:hypothetical protein